MCKSSLNSFWWNHLAKFVRLSHICDSLAVTPSLNSPAFQIPSMNLFLKLKASSQTIILSVEMRGYKLQTNQASVCNRRFPNSLVGMSNFPNSLDLMPDPPPQLCEKQHHMQSDCAWRRKVSDKQAGKKQLWSSWWLTWEKHWNIDRSKNMFNLLVCLIHIIKDFFATPSLKKRYQCSYEKLQV